MTKEQLREEFYARFPKSECSEMELDWLLEKFQEATKEALEGEQIRVEKVIQRMIDENSHIANYYDTAKEIISILHFHSKDEHTNYNHVSHTHCWDNDDMLCGIPLEKHKQCCLCDLETPHSKDEK